MAETNDNDKGAASVQGVILGEEPLQNTRILSMIGDDQHNKHNSKQKRTHVNLARFRGVVEGKTLVQSHIQGDQT